MSFEYDEESRSSALEAVVRALKTTESKSTFCTSFSIPAKNIAVEVDSVGRVNDFDSEKVIKALIKEAKLASFGWRDQTVIDTRVRNVWEIAKEKVSVQGLDFAPILDRIQNGLALAPSARLKAELHNLLIYEPGQFFSTHQDSEKMDGMVATMTVVLPSEFEGGALIVDHHGTKKTFAALKEGGGDINVVAFYADCHHEVKKITKGYRITLTYNLKLESRGDAVSPSHPNLELTRQIGSYFEAGRKSAGGKRDHPLWLVYLLDHYYSEKGLEWIALKGSDRAVAAQFRAAASELGLSTHLALAELHETWQAEEEYSGGYRRRRYHFDNDDEEEHEISEEDLTLVDLLNEEYTLAHWVGMGTEGKGMRPHYVPEEMFCWAKATDTFKPFKSQYEGYMGNYGNTMDRWYHRAAIVLWRKDDDIVNRFVISPMDVLSEATKVLAEDKTSGTAILTTVLPEWPRLKSFDSSATTEILMVASLVGDKALAKSLLSILDLRTLRPDCTRLFLALVEKYGETWTVELLRKWAKTESYLEANEPSNLPSLVSKLQPHKLVIRWLLEHQLAELVRSDKEDEKSLSRVELDEEKKNIIQRARDLLRAAHAAGDEEISTQAVDHILNHERVYAPLTLGKLITALSKDAMSHLWGRMLTESARRLDIQSMKKRTPGDSSILDPIPCKCPDCKTLSNFLKSGSDKQLVWPLAQARRQHIHQTIDGMGIGVSHNTQRTGSPYKLILVKLDEHFEKEAAQRRKAGDHRKSIRELESRIPRTE